jgi:hypothetical protein
VHCLSQAAVKLGYKGVCVAPGGRLAVNYVKEIRPRAIVAVACQKELDEGIRGVREMDGGDTSAIPILVIPLSKDGCVDTEVDVDQALEMVALGCSTELVKERVH